MFQERNGCREVRVYPAECGEQLGRHLSKYGSSRSLVLKSLGGGEGTPWDSSLFVALTLWDTPVLSTPPLPQTICSKRSLFRMPNSLSLPRLSPCGDFPRGHNRALPCPGCLARKPLLRVDVEVLFSYSGHAAGPHGAHC